MEKVTEKTLRKIRRQLLSICYVFKKSMYILSKFKNKTQIMDSKPFFNDTRR